MADLPRNGKLSDRGEMPGDGPATKSLGGWLLALFFGRNGGGAGRGGIEKLIEEVDDDATQIGRSERRVSRKAENEIVWRLLL